MKTMKNLLMLSLILAIVGCSNPKTKVEDPTINTIPFPKKQKGEEIYSSPFKKINI